MPDDRSDLDPLGVADRRNFVDVRNRLWNGRAALLAGAGVSRAAAVPLHDGTPSFPVWRDLARDLRSGLYEPDEETPGPLRLAQEYEAAFGEQALLDLITTRIPDQQHAPGPLHQALLELPWADVFTTNYDTLLERAARRARPPYAPVYVPADLARVKAPRIVKLHGSLPSHLPLVLTEEDFRTYGETRAPFAALVQTALVEHAVVLLGFSYDDPNFLAWSGWARDRLGPLAPPVHLVGALDLPAHRRQLLEGRGVRPVDLGPLFPERDWPDPDTRHHAALSWTVASFAAAEPDHPLDWPAPTPPSVAIAVPAPAPPPLPWTNGRRMPAPATPRPGAYPVSDPPPDPDLNDQRRAWRRERLAYPGWVVAPIKIQNYARRAVERWGDDIRTRAVDLFPAAQISLLREYAWRHRVAGLLLADSELAQCRSALGAVDPAPSVLGLPEPAVRYGDPIPEDLSWSGVLDDWTHLALHLLEGLRRAGDSDGFQAVTDQLARLPLSGEAEARFHYEACRLALGRLDRDALTQALAAWPVGAGGYPYGLTWRAGVLAESGDWAGALRTAREALGALRDAQAVATAPSVALLSQTGWTRQLIAHAERVEAHRERDYRRDVDYRWQRGLTPFGANPADVLGKLQNAVDPPPGAPAPSQSRQRSFDPGHHRTSRSLFAPGYSSDKMVAGQRAILAAEEGAVPHAPAEGFTPSTLPLHGAAWTRLLHPNLAWAVDLQVASKDLPDLFPRVRVGSLGVDDIESLYARVDRAVTSGVHDLSTVPSRGWTHPATPKLAPRLEVLSRLLFRLGPVEKSAAARLAVRMLSLPAVHRDYRLHEPLAHLLLRAARHLPPDAAAPLFSDVMASPVPGLDFKLGAGERWPSVGEILDYPAELPEGAVDPALVERLVTALGATDEDARPHVFWRLDAIDRIGALTPEQRDALALAAIDHIDLGRDHAGFLLPAFLKLPEPARSYAEQTARDLVAAPTTGRGSDMWFQRLDLATVSPLLPGEGLLRWSEAEAESILDRVETWIESAIAEEESDSQARFDRAFEHAREFPSVSGLLGHAVMSALPAGSNEWTRVHSVIEALQQHRVPVGRALAYALRDGVTSVADVAARFRIETASGDPRRFKAAAWGVAGWLLWSECGHPTPPDDTVETVVHAAASGRPEASDVAKALAFWLRNAQRAPSDALAETLGRALLGMIPLAALPSPEDTRRLPTEALDLEADDVARSGSTLAFELNRHEPTSPIARDAVSQWRTLALSSPFPEVATVWSSPGSTSGDGPAEPESLPADSSASEEDG